MSEWFDRAFGPWYPQLYPHRDAAEAATALETIRPCLRPGPLLDLACGGGRHLEGLRRGNAAAWGLDRSATLLAEARRRPGVEGRIIRGDMRRLPFASGVFDSVLMMFTSFGYFPTRDDHRDLLVEIARTTSDGGIFVLDYFNAPQLRKTLVPRSERRTGPFRVEERRRIEFRGGEEKVVKTTEIFDESGIAKDRYDEVVSVYDPQVVEKLMDEAGWIPRSRWGDYEGRPLTESSPRCLWICERKSAR